MACQQGGIRLHWPGTTHAGNKVNEEYAVPQGQQNDPHVGVPAHGIHAFIAAGHVPGRGPYGAAAASSCSS